MDTPAKKDTVRRLVLARRSRLDEDARAEASARATASLLALPEVAAAASVIGFVSIRSEISTLALLRTLLDQDRRVLLPYVTAEGLLRAAPVASLDELEPGYRGIPEPRDRSAIDPASADVVIVPGVAFDAAGRRLGYGGGFYDGFLAGCARERRVGLCFDLQIVDEVPTGARDEPVSVVVTDARVVRAEPIH